MYKLVKLLFITWPERNTIFNEVKYENSSCVCKFDVVSYPSTEPVYNDALSVQMANQHLILAFAYLTVSCKQSREQFLSKKMCRGHLCVKISMKR